MSDDQIAQYRSEMGIEVYPVEDAAKYPPMTEFSGTYV